MPSPGTPQRVLPLPPALLGFAVLLLALTALSFAAGRLAGPVAPGMHRTVPASGDTAPRPGMPGMAGMGGGGTGGAETGR
ncbi:hypothetical protein NX801_18370 [Streptomyces sp. LP05-1]|uniref:Uncharacterized protein n=1 Tax=Streptomyces pyxinae TaxID=2970734 RepID=A0ABT2CJK8_9ACTN|nr:hypothetical protein [Streptomyces sp. LP05-1]MCS0637593.1 hypothetical protein [Streptomyces sp. LP05-1]